MTLDWHYRPVPLENPKCSSNARKESLAMMNAIRYEVKLKEQSFRQSATDSRWNNAST